MTCEVRRWRAQVPWRIDGTDGQEVVLASDYDAALARLRVAVAYLQNIRDRERFDEDGIWYRLASKAEMVEHANGGLEAIGPLPDEKAG